MDMKGHAGGMMAMEGRLAIGEQALVRPLAHPCRPRLGDGVKRNANGIFPMGEDLGSAASADRLRRKWMGPLIAGCLYRRNKMDAMSGSLANRATKVGARVPTRSGDADVVCRAARDSRPYLGVLEASGL
jgi:hypothetical protein